MFCVPSPVVAADRSCVPRRFLARPKSVVTMGCGDACPIFPGTRYEDWELEDPEGEDLATVRRIRDESDTRVQRLRSCAARSATSPTPARPFLQARRGSRFSGSS